METSVSLANDDERPARASATTKRVLLARNALLVVGFRPIPDVRTGRFDASVKSSQQWPVVVSIGVETIPRR